MMMMWLCDDSGNGVWQIMKLNIGAAYQSVVVLELQTNHDYHLLLPSFNIPIFGASANTLTLNGNTKNYYICSLTFEYFCLINDIAIFY